MKSIFKGRCLHWGGDGAPNSLLLTDPEGSGNSFNCCSKSRSWCLSSSSHTNRHKWTFSRMDRQLLRQVDASALFCCDIIQDFKGSKAQTVKIPFFHSSRKWKNSLSLIYENISSEEAAKQRAKRENSKIRHRQHADKEANETVLKENRSQGEQEVTQRLILHSTDVLTASWFTTVRQNTSDADSTKKYGAEKRNEVQEAAYEAKNPPIIFQVSPFPAAILPILEKISSKRSLALSWNCSRARLSP